MLGARLVPATSTSEPDPDAAVISSVGFDSRSLAAGALFVAIPAVRDGHDFIADAVDAGAVAYLQSRPEPVDRRAIALIVPDTAAALMDLAAGMRTRLRAQVVGLTGSVGKTSTKDLILAAVGASRTAWGSARSFNNEQGLPVTILNAPNDAEVLVLEMGMRGHGQISRLCEVAVPEVGLVTNVGFAHTERVGGIEGVGEAKGELVAALPAHGTAVLNADDSRVMAMASRGPASVLTYGTARGADVWITDLTTDTRARARCTIETPWGAYRMRLRVPGVHMAHNAAAAVAVAGVCGADLEAAAAAVSEAEVSEMRMQMGRTTGGAILVNDTYNANPNSMRAALDAIVAMRADRRVAVLGMMAELEDSESHHREIARYAESLGLELWSVGTDLYGAQPLPDPVARIAELGPGDVVLLKGSRVAGLDRLARSVEVPAGLRVDDV